MGTLLSCKLQYMSVVKLLVARLDFGKLGSCKFGDTNIATLQVASTNVAK